MLLTTIHKLYHATYRETIKISNSQSLFSRHISRGVWRKLLPRRVNAVAILFVCKFHTFAYTLKDTRTYTNIIIYSLFKLICDESKLCLSKEPVVRKTVPELFIINNSWNMFISAK